MATNLVLDVMAPAVAGWLLTYAIHSTLLLGLAAVLSIRWREQHAWLDWLWKVALVGAVVTTTAQSGLRLQPLGGRWSPWRAAEAGPVEVNVPSRLPAADMTAAVHRSDVAQPDATAPCCSDVPQLSARGRSVAVWSKDTVQRIAGIVRSYWPAVLVALWLLIAALGVLRFAR